MKKESSYRFERSRVATERRATWLEVLTNLYFFFAFLCLVILGLHICSLFFITLIDSGFASISVQFLPLLIAASPVAPLPAKKSNTRSSELE